MPDKPKLSLEVLRDMFLRERAIPKSEGNFENGMPAVESPATFKPEPFVVGSPQLARSVRNVYKMVPELRSAKVSTIHSGPTEGLMRAFQGSKFGVNDFDKTTQLGVYDKLNNQVFIRPNMDDPYTHDTVAHELTHGMGHSDAIAYPLGHAVGEAREQELGGITDSAIDELVKKLRAAGIKANAR